MSAVCTLLTWNIWFSPRARHERLALLVDEIVSADADVVCLQEVLPDAVAALRAAGGLAAYTLLDDTFDPTEGYGTVILTRLPARGWRRHELPGAMGRDLHVAELILADGAPLAVGTVHLESRRWNGDVRAEQLAAALGLLRAAAPDAVLAGDFNFDDGWPEEAGLRAAPDFQDLWRTHGRGGEGYTVDTRRNGMTLAHKGQEKQTRYDRVLLRTAGENVRCRTIALVGTAPHPRDPEVFVSDHFGLRAVIARDGAGVSAAR